MYDSHNIYSTYMTMLDHLHLYLVETKVIEDVDKILSVDIDWKNLSQSDEQRFLKVTISGRRITINADGFERYVENGFKL